MKKIISILLIFCAFETQCVSQQLSDRIIKSIMQSAEEGSLDAAQLKTLKESGVDLHSVCNEYRESLLHVIIYGAKNELDISAFNKRAELIKILVTEFNISPDVSNQAGQTPAHYCSFLRNKAAIRVFLEQLRDLGADLGAVSKHGGTVLDHFLNDTSEGVYSDRYAAGVSIICAAGHQVTEKIPLKEAAGLLLKPQGEYFGSLEDYFEERAERQLRWNDEHSNMLRALRNDCKCSVSPELLERLKEKGWKETLDDASEL